MLLCQVSLSPKLSKNKDGQVRLRCCPYVRIRDQKVVHLSAKAASKAVKNRDHALLTLHGIKANLALHVNRL